MKAYVPFDFIVNGTSLPAGHYIISTYESNFVLMIQNRDNPEYAKVVSNRNIGLNAGVTHESSKLIFGLSNGRQVLHQISITDDDHTHDIVHGNDVAELVASR
jgi:hypothetical protein